VQRVEKNPGPDGERYQDPPGDAEDGVTLAAERRACARLRRARTAAPLHRRRICRAPAVHL